MSNKWLPIILPALFALSQLPGMAGDLTNSDEASPDQSISASTTLKDVAQDPHQDAIIEIVNRRIMQGFSDGTFRPNAPVSEEALRKIMERLLVVCPGTSNTSFATNNPNQEVSRIRAMVAILRYLVDPAEIEAISDAAAGLAQITDSTSIPAWGLKYAAFAANNGMAATKEKLRAMEPITRSDLSELIAKGIAWNAAHPIKKTVIYSSLVIDCRGLGLVRSMCPEIRDESGAILYPDAKNAPSVDWVETNGLVAYAHELTDSKRSGATPLVIKAVDVAGTGKQAAVISDEDKEQILAEEKTSKFLSKWNIVFLMD